MYTTYNRCTEKRYKKYYYSNNKNNQQFNRRWMTYRLSMYKTMYSELCEVDHFL
jgi:hypothetical protein